MNYYDAAKVRKQTLRSLIEGNINNNPEQSLGRSVGIALSDKFKAKLKGIGEKFNVLNFAKFFGPTFTAVIGKALGRKREDIDYFTGRKQQKKYRKDIIDFVPEKPETSKATSVKSEKLLGNIFAFMQSTRLEDLEYQETQNTYDMLNANMEDDRHKEVIDVLMEAIRSKNKAEKNMKRSYAQREKELKAREKAAEAKKTEATSSKPVTEAATRISEKVSSVASTAAKVGVGVVAIAGASSVSAAIAHAESGKAGYSAANKGTRGNRIIPVQEKLNLEDMSIEEIMKRQAIKWGSSNEKDKLFAVGKYQVIPETLRDAVVKLGIDIKQKFNAQLQDKIFQEYLLGLKRPAIAKYLNSPVDDPVLLKAAVKQMSKEWASVADPDIPGGKTSHYGHGNKASVSVEQASDYLRKDREENLTKRTSTQMASQTNISNRIDADSRQNVDMKKQIAERFEPILAVFNNFSQTVKQNTVMPLAKPDNINPMVR